MAYIPPNPDPATGAKQDAAQTTLTALDGHVDGLEGLAAALNAAVATSAKQDTAQTTLTAIDGHVDGLETLLGATNTALGHLTDGTQTTGITGVVPLPTGAATSALQSSVSVTAHADAVAIIAAVNAPTALPLPAGASTAANQVTANTALGHLTDGTQTTGITGVVPLPTGAATEATVVLLPVAQGSVTAGEKGPLAQGAVTTAAPVYTTAQTSPLSLDTSGNLRVGVSGVVPGTTATSLGKAEDAAHVSGDTGVMLLAVRNDAQAVLSDATGDYIPLTTDSTGKLITSAAVVSMVPGTAATSLGKAEDAGHVSGDTGVMLLAVRNDSNVLLAGTDLDYIPLGTDSNGSLRVNASGLSNVSGVGLLKAEDAAHVSGDSGVMFLAVRNDTGAALTSADGDYSPIAVDNQGVQRVRIFSSAPSATDIIKLEDTAHATGDAGVMMLAVRRDGGGTTTDATGDYSPITTDSQGNVRTVDRSAVAEDSVAADASFGIPSFAVRRDVAASSSGTDGDWSTINTDAAGGLWTHDRTAVSEDTASTTGSFGFPLMAVRRDAATSSSDADGDWSNLNVNAIGDLRVFESSVEVASQFSAILSSVAISVKASAGYLRSVVVTNINASLRYIQVHNKASAPAGADTPLWSIPIPAGTATAPAILILGADIFGPGGLSCTTGVSIGVSTTAATFTAATTTDHTVHGMYV